MGQCDVIVSNIVTIFVFEFNDVLSLLCYDLIFFIIFLLLFLLTRI